jgi:hypothetical protein
MTKNMGLVLEDDVSIQSTCCQNVSIFLGFIDMMKSRRLELTA